MTSGVNPFLLGNPLLKDSGKHVPVLHTHRKIHVTFSGAVTHVFGSETLPHWHLAIRTNVATFANCVSDAFSDLQFLFYHDLNITRNKQQRQPVFTYCRMEADRWSSIILSPARIVTVDMLCVRTQGLTVVEDIMNTNTMKGNMNLVNTADIEGTVKPLAYARTERGTIDYEAYKGLNAQIAINKLTVNVKIVDARRRFGHLDLLVVPVSGSGEVWVERKNIEIFNDPATTRPVSVSEVVKNDAKPQVTMEMVEEFLNNQKLLYKD